MFGEITNDLLRRVPTRLFHAIALSILPARILEQHSPTTTGRRSRAPQSPSLDLGLLGALRRNELRFTREANVSEWPSSQRGDFPSYSPLLRALRRVECQRRRQQNRATLRHQLL